MLKLWIVHDLNNPEVMTEVSFSYPNFREWRWAVLQHEVDAIVAVYYENEVTNGFKFKVFFEEDLEKRGAKTYFEALRMAPR